MKKDFQIKIKLEKDFFAIFLMKGGQEVDKMILADRNNLSEILLLEVDKLLRKNQIYLRSLKEIVLEIEDAGYTSRRIAQSIQQAANYCLTFFNKEI